MSSFVPFTIFLILLTLNAFTFQFTPRFLILKTQRLKAFSDQTMIQQSDTVFIAPTLAVSADNFSELTKLLPSGSSTAIITKSNLISYIDGTPFTLGEEYLSSSNFCIFSKDASMTENIMNVFLDWARYFRQFLK